MNETHENKTENNQQKPRKYFLRAHECPWDWLIRVDPHIHSSRDILSEPDKYCHQTKSQYQIHRIGSFSRGKIDSCPSKKKQHSWYQKISNISYKMMRKKIRINSHRKRYRPRYTWIVHKSKIKYPPHSSEITPNSTIHKSGKQWNT